MTRIGLAVAGIGIAAALTGCGGSDGSDGDDFTDQSGEKIASAAKKAMGGLDAVKVSGTITTSGQEVTIDVQTNDQGDCTGSIGSGGGTADLLGTGGDVWFKPDEAFWRANAGDTADQIVAAVGDKWVVVPAGGGGFDEFCDVDKLLDELIDSDDDEGKTYTAKDVEEVDGQDAVPIQQKDDDGTSVGYVLVDDPHYLVKIEKTEGEDTGKVTFSDFDEDVDVEAPAEDEIVDLDNLQ
jgi:hypothetical protein